MHCFLIGYRGSGKSTVGLLLAQRLGWPFLDTDQLVEQNAGRSIRSIFAEDGEQAFRDLESAAIATAATSATSTVISLGGGAVLREANQAVLLKAGQCVWLNASAEVLYQRISGDKMSADRRPSLTSLDGYAEVVALLQQREPIYHRLANKTIMVEGLSPDEIVADIADWINSR